MWDHIIIIHSGELLSTKIKEFRINKSLKKEEKKCASQWQKLRSNNNLTWLFLPNNNIARLFKELTK